MPLGREDVCRFMVDQAVDAIVLFDVNTLEFIEFNEAACRSLGYTREEFAALRLSDLIAMQPVEETVKKVASLAAAGGGTVEVRHRRKDGAVRDILASNRPVRLGDRSCMTAVWVDITERKQAAAKMAELNRELQFRVAELETILNTVPVGIAIADGADLRQVHCNSTLADMLVLDADQPLHNNNLFNEPVQFQVFRNGQRLDPPHFTLATAMRDRKVIRNAEIDIIRSDGQTVPICCKAAPLFDEAGKVNGGIAVYWDISERHQIETAMRRAREAAESANRAKSEFLANVSHEFRTPMTAILGFADLLSDTSLSPANRLDYLHGIQKNGDSLLVLINDMLDLSRIEAHKLTLRMAEHPLAAFIDDVADVANVLANQKGLTFRVERQPPLPETIHTDATRLRQILLNLVGNAVKFTTCGEVRLGVRSVRSGDASKVQFTVADTGCGIPATMLAKIFQPFTQADTSVNRAHGGAGLGLTISKRLAEMLHGNIAVASTPGVGSQFTLTLDVGQPTNESPPSRLPDDAAESTVARDATFFGRVLVVEDDSDIRRLFRAFLRKMNVDGDFANNGLAACELAEKSRCEGQPYKLIMMDLQMPIMSGYDAVRELRNQGWTGPILALTAHAAANDQQRCTNAGFDGFVTKPIALNRFRDILARYLTENGT